MFWVQTRLILFICKGLLAVTGVGFWLAYTHSVYTHPQAIITHKICWHTNMDDLE